MPALTLTLVLVLVAFGIVFVVALKRPGVVLSLAFCQYGFDQLMATSIPTVGMKPWIPQVLVSALIAMTLLVVIQKDRRLFGPGNGSILWLVIGYFAYFFLSLIWSPAVDKLDFVFGHLPIIILLVFAAPVLIRSHEDLIATMWCTVLIGSILALAVLLSPAADYHQGRLRLISYRGWLTRSNPLAIADMCGIVLMMAVLLNLTGKSQMAGILRYIFAIIAILVAGLSSRGEVVAAIAAVTLVVPISRKVTDIKRFFGLVVTGVILFAVIYFVADIVLSSGSAERWSFTSISEGIFVRLSYYATVLEAYAETPGMWLTGLGANFSHTVLPGNIYPHNHLIQALTETGLIGVIIWIAIPLLVFKRFWTLWPIVRDDPKTRGVYSVLLAMTLYYLVLGFKKASVIDPNWFMAAILVERFYSIMKTHNTNQWAQWHAANESPDYDAEYDDAQNFDSREPRIAYE